jgi:hypothetical protein
MGVLQPCRLLRVGTCHVDDGAPAQNEVGDSAVSRAASVERHSIQRILRLLQQPCLTLYQEGVQPCHALGIV